MNLKDSLELMDEYAVCPKCRSEELGNGNGGIIVENNTFRRFCICGYDITLNAKKEKIDTIKMAIELSVEELKILREFLGVQQIDDFFEIVHKYDLDILPDDIETIQCKLYQKINELL